MTIGESIRYHRKKLNLTQAQLAERLNVTPQAVSRWESGTGLLDLSMAAPLARALGTTTDELLPFVKNIWAVPQPMPSASGKMTRRISMAAEGSIGSACRN